jgi:hypothetical protein
MDEDVFRFDIPVNDIPFFQKFEGNDHLRDESADNFVRKTLFVLKNEIFEGPLVAVLDEEKESIGTFLGVDVFEDVGVRDLAEEVDFLKKGVGGDHGGVNRDLLDCELGIFIALACFVVAEVYFGHGALPQHVGVVDLILVQNQKSLFRVHPSPMIIL